MKFDNSSNMQQLNNKAIATICLISICIAASLTVAMPTTTITTSTISSSSHEDSQTQSPANKTGKEGSFLLLLSPDEIVLVQTPLIDNGNIKILYRMNEFSPGEDSKDTTVDNNPTKPSSLIQDQTTQKRFVTIGRPGFDEPRKDLEKEGEGESDVKFKATNSTNIKNSHESINSDASIASGDQTRAQREQMPRSTKNDQESNEEATTSNDETKALPEEGAVAASSKSLGKSTSSPATSRLADFFAVPQTANEYGSAPVAPELAATSGSRELRQPAEGNDDEADQIGRKISRRKRDFPTRAEAQPESVADDDQDGHDGPNSASVGSNSQSGPNSIVNAHKTIADAGTIANTSYVTSANLAAPPPGQVRVDDPERSYIGTTTSAAEATTERRLKRSASSIDSEDAFGHDGKSLPTKTKNNAKFCDFDVHVHFGYVFAADSFGRIHRFRLTMSPASSSSEPDVSHNDYSNISLNDGSNATAYNEDDHYDDDGDDDLPLLQHNADNSNGLNDNFEWANELKNAILSNHDFDGKKLDYFGQLPSSETIKNDNAKKVERADKSQFGRQHPTASGARLTMPMQSEFGHEATMASKVANTRLRSKIIWSRKGGKSMKMARQHQRPRADDRNDPTIQATSDDHGESTNYPNDESATKFGVTSEQHQLHLDGLNQSHNSHNDFTTQVAVDWLNNVLFVLDNNRLLAMDLNGHNELVLIDDFTQKNRPIDIKLSPSGNFLYWLQVGQFHTTIYKFDLRVAIERLSSNAMQYLQSKLTYNENQIASTATTTAKSGDSPGKSTVDMAASLLSRHYAHPIVTNLPLDARLFIIDQLQSRIYVPIGRSPGSSDDAELVQATQNIQETHMNSSNNGAPEEEAKLPIAVMLGNNPGHYGDQILAYNLDGTDVGPLRRDRDRAHLASLGEMVDMTLDAQQGYMYWLTNKGRDIFEEYKSEKSFYSAQHNLDGKQYEKLIHFGASNQPLELRPRSNLTILLHLMSEARVSASLAPSADFKSNPSVSNRWIREPIDFPTSKQANLGTFNKFLATTLFVTVLVFIGLVYLLVFQHQQNDPDAAANDNESSSGRSSSLISAAAKLPSYAHQTATSSITRWIGGRDRQNQTSRGSNQPHQRPEDNSSPKNLVNGISFDYDEAANAIDQHYRDMMNERHSIDEHDGVNPRLVNLSGWPSSMNDMPNKLYVPIEVLQDDALASINRISLDELKIEYNLQLGEGHFGTVLQGTVTQHKPQFRHRARPNHNEPSSESSGHGSSSTSSEFITAMSSAGYVVNGDYLTPKSSSQCNSAIGDYALDNVSRPDSCISNSYGNTNVDNIGVNGEDIVAIVHRNFEDDSLSAPASSSSNYQNQSDDIKLHLDDCAIKQHQQQIIAMTTMPATTTTTNQATATTTLTSKFKVAIKKLKDNASLDEKRDFLREAKLLANFNHPNIVQLVGICLDRGSTLIVMELMLGGDLIRYMKDYYLNELDGNESSKNNDTNELVCEPNELTLDDLLSICLDIVNGCCYLEQLNHIHRDIAARNCLVSSRNRHERVVKLADFGLARDIYKGSYYKKRNDAAMPLKWMAPECCVDMKFSTKSDVWSFGVVMWEVLTFCQEKPYQEVEPFFMHRHLSNGHRLPKPRFCNQQIFELMNECWQFEADNRPTFHQCRDLLLRIKRELGCDGQRSVEI